MDLATTLLRSLPHLENTTQCITKHFQNKLQVKHAALLFKNIGTSSNSLITTFSPKNRKRNPSLKLKRVTTFGAEPNTTNERIGLRLDVCGLAAQCFATSEITIVNDMLGSAPSSR